MPFRNVYLSITTLIVCASFFLSKLFALNKLFVRTSVLSYDSSGSHAFFSEFNHQMVASEKIIKIKLAIQNIGITEDERNLIIDDTCP